MIHPGEVYYGSGYTPHYYIVIEVLSASQIEIVQICHCVSGNMTGSVTRDTMYLIEFYGYKYIGPILSEFVREKYNVQI